MATEVVDAPLGEMRRASAAKGFALTPSTFPITLAIPPGSKWASITPRNFTTAVVAAFQFNPWLTVLTSLDNFLTPGRDDSEAAQDGLAATDIEASSIGILANGDQIWVGSQVPFRGVECDIDAANGTTNALAAHYWNGRAMADLSPTDGTASGGVSLAVDGSITWTMPTTGALGLWKSASLNDILAVLGLSGAAVFPFDGEAYTTPMYWTRLTWDIAHDSATRLNSMHALNRSTAAAELVAGQTITEKILRGPGGFGCIEASVDAGTGNLIVNVATLGGAFPA